MMASTLAISQDATLDTASVSQDFESFIAATLITLRDNVHWGDVLQGKTNQSIRIYFQNFHGITSDNMWDKW